MFGPLDPLGSKSSDMVDTPLFPHGKALTLVQVDSGGKLVVPPEAAACLEKIRGPVAVVVVCGRFRSGKSSLLSRLIGHKSFEVSHSVQACTKGIRLYDAPLCLPDKRQVLLLDTEGLMAMDSDATHDTRVFALGILLASSFVYNVTGTIDETTLSTLRVVVQFASLMLAPAPSGPATEPSSVPDYEELAAHMPAFNVLVRDFGLRLERSDGTKLTPTEWLEDSLSTEEAASHAAKLSNTDDKVEIRRVIKRMFPTRECFTLPRPSGDEEVMARLDTAQDAELSPAFLAGVTQLRQRLVLDAPVKRIMGEDVTGPGLLAITRQLVDRINTGSTPRIRDAWVLLAELRARDAAECSIRHMRTVTGTWAESDMPLHKLRICLGKVGTESLRRFDRAVPEGGGEVRERLVNADIPNREAEVLALATRRRHAMLGEALANAQKELAVVAARLREWATGVRLPHTSPGALWENAAAVLTRHRDRIAAAELPEPPFEAMSALMPELEQISQALAAGAEQGGSRQREQKLELELDNSRELFQKAESVARKVMDGLRREGEVELERQVKEAREAASAEREELQTRCDRLTSDCTQAVHDAEAARSESKHLRQDLEAAEESLGNDTEAERQALAEQLGTVDDLRQQLLEAHQRADRNERSIVDLREVRVRADKEFEASLETVRVHARDVVDARATEASVAISNAETSQADAEAATEVERQTLVRTQRESQQMVATLNAQLEVAQTEAVQLRQAVEAARNRERDVRREEREATTRAQEQLTEARRQSQTELTRREGEWTARFVVQAQTASELEGRVVHLEVVNENGKRELERGREVAEENKRLRRTVQDAEMSHTRAEVSAEGLRKRLQTREEDLEMQTARLMQSDSKQLELERRLAVAEFKVSVGASI